MFSILAAAVRIGGRRRSIAVLTFVKGGVEGVEVLRIQPILNDSQSFTETLKVYHFSGPQELDGLAYVGIFYQA